MPPRAPIATVALIPPAPWAIMAGVAEVLFVLGVGVVLAIALGQWLLQQRRREELAAVAARHGLQHSQVDPFGCTRVAFPLFRKGDGRVAENVVWRDRADGLPIRAFDFSYYTERRDDTGNVVRNHKHFS